MIRKRNSDVLLENLDLDGKRVLDVGSGDGAMARLMAQQGARVVGIECSPRQLAKARAAERVADEAFVAGVAEQMPAADGSVDIVVFFNSLHHVPMAAQELALVEAARVLKPDGLLYVSEPVAAGEYFELVRPVDDETTVRAHAYEVVLRALAFTPVREITYIHTVRHRDFEGFRDRIVSANAEREQAFAAQDAELRRMFHESGAADGGTGRSFEQPMRVNLLRRI